MVFHTAVSPPVLFYYNKALVQKVRQSPFLSFSFVLMLLDIDLARKGPLKCEKELKILRRYVEYPSEIFTVKWSQWFPVSRVSALRGCA